MASPDDRAEPFVELDDIGLRHFFERFGKDSDPYLKPLRYVADLMGTMDVSDILRRRFYAHKNPNIGILFSVLVHDATLPKAPRLQDVMLYCQQDCLDNMRECLPQTNFLDFKLWTVFRCLHKIMNAVLRETLEKYGKLEISGDESAMAIIPKEAAELAPKCPSEVYVRPLGKDDAVVPYQCWRYRFRQSFEFFADQVAALPSAGVFLKENDQLVSWICVNHSGALGSFYTLEDYRQRGYGVLALKWLSSTLGQRNLTPTACIESYNRISYSCFHSLGFRSYIENYVYSFYYPEGMPYDNTTLKALANQ